MSAHADLIAAAGSLLVPVAAALAVYAWVRWLAFREQRRHNLAVERHNYRIWQQIKRLGDCDGEEKPYVPVRSFAEAQNAMIRGGRS